MDNRLGPVCTVHASIPRILFPHQESRSPKKKNQIQNVKHGYSKFYTLKTNLQLQQSRLQYPSFYFKTYKLKLITFKISSSLRNKCDLLYTPISDQTLHKIKTHNLQLLVHRQQFLLKFWMRLGKLIVDCKFCYD